MVGRRLDAGQCDRWPLAIELVARGAQGVKDSVDLSQSGLGMLAGSEAAVEANPALLGDHVVCRPTVDNGRS